MKRLEEMRAREQAATRGGWQEENGPDQIGQDWVPYETVIGMDEHHTYLGSTFKWIFKPADKAFVAHARADVPWLLDFVETLAKAPCDSGLYGPSACHPYQPVCWPCKVRLRESGGLVEVARKAWMLGDEMWVEVALNGYHYKGITHVAGKPDTWGQVYTREHLERLVDQVNAKARAAKAKEDGE